ncbi:MGMT family protein [Lentisalinibacter salinarum]|uniref:MGMT family protein n=1 Tax=Lentisalinibacter salinarum TaxID=2992239 RepID=UPI003863CE4B
MKLAGRRSEPDTLSRKRRERIRAMVRSIPPGCVASYGQIGRLVGLPRGARLVGRVMATLPEGTDVPWHRVVNAAGRISLPEGSAGYFRQRDRLREEGVIVSRGRISMARFGWQPDLDELIWRAAPAADASREETQ